jgi:hypothetical protein
MSLFGEIAIATGDATLVISVHGGALVHAANAATVNERVRAAARELIMAGSFIGDRTVESQRRWWVHTVVNNT